MGRIKTGENVRVGIVFYSSRHVPRPSSKPSVVAIRKVHPGRNHHSDRRYYIGILSVAVEAFQAQPCRVKC